jgi:predicted ATPase
VITGIDIETLRGIARGGVAELSPLTVLVGTNGCAKSTVLDTLLIGAPHAPGELERLLRATGAWSVVEAVAR